MQLDWMPSWLRALVVFAALMGGPPTLAWAHVGHGHTVQRPVGDTTVVHRVTATMRAEHVAVFAHSVLEGLGAFFRTAAATEFAIPTSATHGNWHFGDLRADLGALPAKIPGQPLQQTDCCCGGIACHAGMDIPTLDASIHFVFSDRGELSPVSAMDGATPDGIERPPRGMPL